jgi:FMN hydrolase / 5-amino-6-(5-phospho-D-ribitylamino)uracil phosphatase
MHPIPRALTLDLDDTLWPVAPVIARAEEVLHTWLATQAPRTAARYPVVAMRHLRAEVGRAQPALAHDLTALRLAAITQALQRSGDDPALAGEALDLFMAERNRVVFYDEVLPALERLAARFPLLALSNGNADVHQVGLGHCFVGRIGAREAGVAKPDARIFAAACQALALPASAVLHVGDDWVMDVLGARSAGLHSAWVHRGASPPEDAKPPTEGGVHLHVHDLQALAEALGA